MADTEMPDVPVEGAEPEVELATVTGGDIGRGIALVTKAQDDKKRRHAKRALRVLATFRKNLTREVLQAAIETHLDADGDAIVAALNVWLDENHLDEDVVATNPAYERDNVTALGTRLYLHLAVLVWLIDESRLDHANACAAVLFEIARNVADHILTPITARAFFYFALAAEKAQHLSDLRPQLLVAHRTAVLNDNISGQAVLLNMLLRSYLADNLYDQADRLVSKSTFPPTASNNQTARYLYYLGRIRSIQLEYTEAHTVLMQAIRKAPANTARGFKTAAQKLATIVQLLRGELPEHRTFFQPEYAAALRPYYELAQAVRIGDLTAFHAVTDKFGNTFMVDKTATLIKRLRHNVIRTGLRNIAIAYSRVSLADVAAKLGLESAADAEAIVAKAIADDFIDAVIDHKGGFMRSNDTIDVYATNEPQTVFMERVQFCLDIHNEAVLAMSYPRKSAPKKLPDPEPAIDPEDLVDEEETIEDI